MFSILLNRILTNYYWIFNRCSFCRIKSIIWNLIDFNVEIGNISLKFHKTSKIFALWLQFTSLFVCAAQFLSIKFLTIFNFVAFLLVRSTTWYITAVQYMYYPWKSLMSSWISCNYTSILSQITRVHWCSKTRRARIIHWFQANASKHSCHLFNHEISTYCSK